jgi:hypothetical protein
MKPTPIRFPKELKQQAMKQAKNHGLSFAAYVRLLITDNLRKWKDQ